MQRLWTRATHTGANSEAISLARLFTVDIQAQHFDVMEKANDDDDNDDDSTMYKIPNSSSNNKMERSKICRMKCKFIKIISF